MSDGAIRLVVTLLANGLLPVVILAWAKDGRTETLFEARSYINLWSQTYDRTLDNIFQIQDEIGAAVVDGLKIILLGLILTEKTTDPKV